jgi:hypothetical protein
MMRDYPYEASSCFLVVRCLRQCADCERRWFDALGLARMKTYTSERVSSSNRFQASNDDSKRIMPGETLVMADLPGAGIITHIWLTAAGNEFAWPRLIRLRIYYDGHKTPSVDVPLGIFLPLDMVGTAGRFRDDPQCIVWPCTKQLLADAIPAVLLHYGDK